MYAYFYWSMLGILKPEGEYETYATDINTSNYALILGVRHSRVTYQTQNGAPIPKCFKS